MLLLTLTLHYPFPHLRAEVHEGWMLVLRACELKKERVKSSRRLRGSREP